MPEPLSRPLYVVGDVHGHLAELTAALTAAGLVDDAGDWAGRDVDLWFLGDFVDRGPDGLAVVDTVMRLSEQAAASAGSVDSVIGNHEVLLLGYRRFGTAADSTGTQSFGLSWLRNGGQQADQDGLTEAHLAWLTGRPAVALVGDHLLMHADTTGYLHWGGSVAEVNSALAQDLASEDIDTWLATWRRLTARHAFRGEDGQGAAEAVLAALGGSRIVHGHSVIAPWLGVEPQHVTEPLLYAGGRAVGVDGGLFAGGPCLVLDVATLPAPA